MAVTTGDIISGRYKLLEKLGDGGMGDVYLAEDLQLLRQVAIKTIRNELKENAEVRRRIDRECNLHAKLGVHPNIVALHDRLDDDENIFLIMEYVQGETASALMAKKKADGSTVAISDAVLIAMQTLEALSYIHENDIIHRDIKPSNIILKESRDGYVAKLMDFGIAYLESDDQDLTKLTTMVTGGPGTPAYMAPERIDAETFGEQGPATDLYSVGIILYELFGGTPPFHGSMTEVFTGHLAKTPNIASLGKDIPPRLLEIVEKSLKKKQEERYRDARSFLGDLKAANMPEDDKTALATSGATLDKTLLATGRERVALEEAISAAKTSVAPQKQKSKIPYIIAAVLGVLLIAGGTALTLYYHSSDSSKEPVNKAAVSVPKASVEKKPFAASNIDEALPSSEKNVGVTGVAPATIPAVDTSQVKEFSLEPPVTVTPSNTAKPVILDPTPFSLQDKGQGDDGTETAADAFRKAREAKKLKTAQPATASKPKTKAPAKRNTINKQSASSSGWIIIESKTEKIK